LNLKTKYKFKGLWCEYLCADQNVTLDLPRAFDWKMSTLGSLNKKLETVNELKLNQLKLEYQKATSNLAKRDMSSSRVAKYSAKYALSF
jgi:hypothetical protein